MTFLAQLARSFDQEVNLWPFHLHGHRITIYEIWPRLLTAQLGADLPKPPDTVEDEHEVQVTAHWMRSHEKLAHAPEKKRFEEASVQHTRRFNEGWILAVPLPEEIEPPIVL
jgi:hypothetical protein